MESNHLFFWEKTEIVCKLKQIEVNQQITKLRTCMFEDSYAEALKIPLNYQWCLKTMRPPLQTQAEAARALVQWFLVPLLHGSL